MTNQANRRQIRLPQPWQHAHHVADGEPAYMQAGAIGNVRLASVARRIPPKPSLCILPFDARQAGFI